jgi:hypothetical protein
MLLSDLPFSVLSITFRGKLNLLKENPAMLIKSLSNSSGVSEATIESVIGFSPTVIIPASNDHPKALGSVAKFLNLFKKNQSEEVIKASRDKHDARVKARRDKHDAKVKAQLDKHDHQ